MGDPNILDKIRFAAYQNLTSLSLSFYDREALPPEIGHLTELQALNISGPCTTLPPEIASLVNLTSLSLVECDVTALPPEIGGMSNLRRLVLMRVRLATLPAEISLLSNLTELNIRETRLESLPPEFGQLQKLRSLILSHTALTTLPNEIGMLTNLIELDLSEQFTGSIACDNRKIIAVGFAQFERQRADLTPGPNGRSHPIERSIYWR